MFWHAKKKQLLMDISSTPIRAEPDGSRVCENFTEKKDCGFFTSKLLLAEASARGRVRKSVFPKSWSGGQDFPQINRNED